MLREIVRVINVANATRIFVYDYLKGVYGFLFFFKCFSIEI